MRHIVGIADEKVSGQPGDVIVTHGLGSCLGLTVHDGHAGVGGMLHVMMPLSQVNPDKAKANPFMFVDTGVPAFFHELYAAGAVKGRMVVKVAGGAFLQTGEVDRFGIGRRNYATLKKILWKNDILIDAEDVGGNIARTMYLEVGSGKVWLHTAGADTPL